VASPTQEMKEEKMPRIILTEDQWDFSGNMISHRKNEVFNSVSDEGPEEGYIFAETLDYEEVIAVNYGEFLHLD
jgi:hypothetical protein